MGEAKRRKLSDTNYGKIPRRNKKNYEAILAEDKSLIIQDLMKANSWSFRQEYQDYLIISSQVGLEKKGAGLLVMPGIKVFEGKGNGILFYPELFYLSLDEVDTLPCLCQRGKNQCRDLVDAKKSNVNCNICFIYGDQYETTWCMSNKLDEVMTYYAGICAALRERERLLVKNDLEVMTLHLDLYENWEEKRVFVFIDY
jgi:hypothetical protein